MSAFYDLASLVLVPSGYKASKVYAQKPLTTDGQLTFSRASTATRVNSAGLIEEVASNVPRLDYLNSSCPRLLLEPQRTNVITNNNNFVTGASNVTTTANNATSPEGYQNADLIAGDAGTLTKVANFNGASAGQYTVSVFAKYNTQQWIQIGAGGITSFANFDIQNGVVGTTNVTSSIEDYGNGWYRCSMVMVSGTPLSHYVGIITNGTSARLSTTASTGSFWAYGYQSEIGTYPTSVIPTLGSAVTRGEDNTLTTGLSAVLPQTAGTLFWEIDYTLGSTITMLAANADTTDYTFLQIQASGLARGGVFQNSTLIQRFSLAGLTSGTHKMAFAYATNSFAFYVNGNLVNSATSGSTASVDLSQISLDWDATDFARVHQALLFKTRLTNAQLAELTTL